MSGIREGSIVACHWNGWRKYLLEKVLPPNSVHGLDFGVDGHELATTLLGRSPRPSAVVLHINASRCEGVINDWGGLTETLVAAGVRVLNTRLRDIRKSVVQAENLALGLPSTTCSRDGPAHDLIMVKTELNARGLPDARIVATCGSDAKVEESSLGDVLVDGEYRVERRSEIEPGWWDDPRLALERYIRNSDDVFFRVYFAGEACMICEGRSDASVMRMQNATDRVDFFAMRALADDEAIKSIIGPRRSSVLTNSVTFAEGVGLDFGCIDLVMDDDDDAYVVDVNLTPYWGPKDVDTALSGGVLRGLTGTMERRSHG